MYILMIVSAEADTHRRSGTQASKVNAALSRERQRGGAAAAQAAETTLQKQRDSLQTLEQKQSSARSSADDVEAELQTQVSQHYQRPAAGIS